MADEQYDQPLATASPDEAPMPTHTGEHLGSVRLFACSACPVMWSGGDGLPTTCPQCGAKARR